MYNKIGRRKGMAIPDFDRKHDPTIVNKPATLKFPELVP